MSYDDEQGGQSSHTTRMRRMMRFVRGLIDHSGASLGQIAQVATALAQRDGCNVSINAPFVGRLGGQGDWYVQNADDFFYMRVYYVLRALDSSMEESAAEEIVVVQALRRIRHPQVREWVVTAIRDAANLDASLPRERSPYVMQGPFQPPAVALPEVHDGGAPEETAERPSLGEMGQTRLAEVDRQDGAKRGHRKQRGSDAGEAGLHPDGAEGTNGVT
jgi:hypothetical protein